MEEEEDYRALNFVKQTISDSPNVNDKDKLEHYLDRLEKNILDKRLLSEGSSSMSSPQGHIFRSPSDLKHHREFSKSKSGDLSSDNNKDDIQRELKELSDHVAIYHQEWNRRRELYL